MRNAMRSPHHLPSAPLFASALLLAFALAAPLHAQDYASSVAVGGGEIFVGEPGNEMSPGAVYLYRRSADGAWSERAKLMASDAAAGDHFGRGIGVSGDALVIGATVVDGNTGAAYFFTREGGEWRQMQRVQPADVGPEDNFGRTAVLSGDLALVSTWGQHDGTGAVYVFRRDPSSGRWVEDGKLLGDDSEPKDYFGGSLAVRGDVAVVGVPQKNRRSGAVYVFRRDEAGTWTQEAKLEASDAEPNVQFGNAVALRGDRILIGAPGFGRGTGAVYTFRRNPDSGEWEEGSRLLPFDGPRRAFFGVSLALDRADVWVGAPGVNRQAGRIYRYRHDDASDAWSAATVLPAPEVESRDSFGGSIALSRNVAVVGLTGDDFGAGTAEVFERGPDGGWTGRGKIFSQLAGLDPVVGKKVRCADGSAALFQCGKVDLVSFLPVSGLGGGRGEEVNDVWGWTDPETGREYGLVGRSNGTAFVDVSDPANPVYLGVLPRTEGSPGSIWRDIKVYRNHAYIVSDAAGAHGMQVFDLTRLGDVRDPPVIFRETAHYGGIHSAHNLVIDQDTGFAYAVGSSGGGETCGGGLHMIDIRDPENPSFAGCFADPSTGRQKTGYTHDAQCVVYHGPDAEHEGREICLGANETALSIADVTDKRHPVSLAVASYPNVGYTHQGWLTEDQRYFYMDDELDEINGGVERTRTLVWDVEDLDDPVLVKEYFGTSSASDHNLYIVGDYVYQSNYVSGLHVLDIHNPVEPVEVGFFDTVPYGDNAPGFGGSWSNYPFFKSGVILVTSGKEGLFVVRRQQPALVP
ncbi:MAG: choice-of-anchor B family protein [Gemmatimonadota bacterium]